MITYTPESKEQIRNMFMECRHWGIYSDTFQSELHKKLSVMHLRDDAITVTYVEFKATPDHTNKLVHFSCELSLRWDSGIIGGLVWNNNNQTFSIHT